MEEKVSEQTENKDKYSQENSTLPGRNPVPNGFSNTVYFNPLPTSIIRLENGTIYEVNEAFCQLLGWSREELLGHSAIEIHYWESLEARKLWVDAIRKEGELRDYPAQWLDRNRQKIFVSIFAHIIDIEGIPHILAMTRDDTAVIQSRQAIEQKQQELSALFAFLPDPTFAIDQNGIVIAWNRLEAELTGIPAAEIIGKGNHEVGYRLYGVRRPVLADMILKENPDFIHSYKFLVREGNTLYGESDGVMLKGQRRTYTAKASLILDPEGKVVGAIQQGRDVTSIREAQRKLDQNEMQIRQLSLAVEQSPHCVIITNLEWQIEYANSQFHFFYTINPDQSPGRNVLEILFGPEESARTQGIRQQLQQPEPWVGEVEHRFKNGTWVTLTSAIPIHQPNGTITNYLITEQDITEAKTAEAELERHRQHLEEEVNERTLELATAKEVAEQASQAKGSFLANMSHEIRTPLNAVIGLTRILEKRNLPDESAQTVHKISVAAQHLLSIVNDILDYSKIEAGKMEIEIQDIDLTALTAQIVDLMQFRADEKKLSLRSQIAPGVPLRVKGDPMRLSQILLNFIGNAIKFTSRGDVTLRICREGENAADNAQLLFEVEDHGIGISAEQAAKLFQPFEQAESSTSRKYGGTGLGLAISHKLAELMKGSVGVRSHPSQGSIFWLRINLPIPSGFANHTTPTGSEEHSRKTLATHANARILVVEDNLFNQEIIIDLLQDAGLPNIDLASNGEEAVEKCAAKSYDLILMDMQMPVMDGIEATRHLRNRPQHRATPILGVTANAFTSDRAQCLAAGMNDIVAKPIDPERLYSAILKHLGETHETVPTSDMPELRPPPTSAPTDYLASILEKIAAIPGIDTDVGLRIQMGKVDNYLKMLSRFLSSEDTDVNQLRFLLESGRSAEATRLCHTLKGTSGMLGLMAIQQYAAELETALKESAPSKQVEALIRNLYNRLSTLQIEIQKITP